MKSDIFKNVLISLVLIGKGLANFPVDPAEYAKWEADSLAAINAQAGIPSQQAIPKLGAWIQRLSQDRTPNSEKGDKPVFHAAKAALLAIPGHAGYYEKAIKELQFRLESAPKDEKWNYANDYSKLQWDGFQILGQLPSPETVRVLGDFLYDESGGFNPKDGDPMPSIDEIMTQQKKNCVLVERPLFNLIDNPPVSADQGNAVEVWRLWYEQVKAGNRTFRFKGNPTEYDLNGPAPKEKLQRVERDRKRDGERAVGHKKSTITSASEAVINQTNKPYSIARLFAAVGLIGAAVWYFLRGRKTA